MGVETIDEISRTFKIGVVIFLVACLFEFIGMGSSHWSLTKSDDYGKVEFTGLWEKCMDINLGVGDGEEDFECEGFVWEDAQVSHWFRTIQTLQVLAVFGMIGAGILLGIYIFISRLRGWSFLRYLSVGIILLCGLFIISTCIVFGSLKDVLKARQMPSSYVTLSWSFGFSLFAGLLDIICTGIFLAGK